MAVNKTAESYALAILNAIQAAEAAGLPVEVCEGAEDGYHALSVAGSPFRLLEPTEEGEPWDMGVTP